MLSYFKRVFSLDFRSIALLRISVGLTLVFDIIQRSHSLTSHYTDSGVLPRHLLFKLWNEPNFYSLYYINGNAFWVTILFIASAIFAMMLIAGYRTRLAAVLSFVLLISLHSRNPLVLQGGDVALRVILFWMMFLPLAKRFSVDALLGREIEPKEKEYFSVSSIAYTLQFIIIWTFTGILKDGAPWVANFTAVAMALTLDTFTTSFGQWLRNFKNLLYYFTFITIFLEKFSFAFFISPFKNAWVRLVGLILLNILIIGFNLSFRLGLFGMIMVSISLGLLPGLFWDKIIKPITNFMSLKSQQGMTIFYDGDCNFCSRISRATTRILLLHPETKIVISNNDKDALDLMHSAHSWVVRDSHGVSYTGFRAFVSLMENAFFYRIIAPVFLFWPILQIGEQIYRFISNNRPMTCITPIRIINSKNFTDKNREKTKNIILWTLLVVLIFWNIFSIPKYNQHKIPTFFKNTILTLRLDQKWNMFAPYPTVEDGYYVIPGVLRDGTGVNVYTGDTNVNYEKPKNMAWVYKDQRWQKYMMNIWLKDFDEYRLGYGQYLCRSWNNTNSFDKQLMNFKIIYMLEITDMNTLNEHVVEPVTIWEHRCFD